MKHISEASNEVIKQLKYTIKFAPIKANENQTINQFLKGFKTAIDMLEERQDCKHAVELLRKEYVTMELQRGKF